MVPRAKVSTLLGISCYVISQISSASLQFLKSPSAVEDYKTRQILSLETENENQALLTVQA